MGMKAMPMTKKAGNTVPAVSIGCQAGNCCCLNFEFLGSLVFCCCGPDMVNTALGMSQNFSHKSLIVGRYSENSGNLDTLETN